MMEGDVIGKLASLRARQLPQSESKPPACTVPPAIMSGYRSWVEP
jgi:hypothetical protein